MTVQTNKVEKEQPKEVAAPVAKAIPDFDQYINVILTKESYEVVKAAVAKYPEKLIKIMQYVNSPDFQQEQLKEVFSRPVF